MDSRIRFETKEDSNARRERAFLALSPSERLMWFLRSFNGRGTVVPEDRSRHHVIRKKKDDAVR